MDNNLRIGDVHEFDYVVGADKMVPDLYPESPEFVEMPRVFATGFMVGLLEWAAIRSLNPHLEPGEGSLGTYVDIRHSAPTPAGATLTVTATVTKVDVPYVEWEVTAVDGDGDVAAHGTHGRNVIETERFLRRVEAKRTRLVEG